MDRDPATTVAQLYEQAEAEAARAGERLVASGGFASLLGLMAENAAALSRLSGDALDLVLRNLRLAGRRDVVRLARQLGRTEDKLERVLQELEALRDELAARDGPAARATRNRGGAGARAGADGAGEAATRPRKSTR